VKISQSGQGTKSLRSSPLRGGKSREADSRSRGQRGEGQHDQQALCWRAAYDRTRLVSSYGRPHHRPHR